VTALCGGGTSQPKPGLDAYVTYSAGAIALVLQKYGGDKLVPLIPLLGLAPMQLSSFCAADPPALPTFTEAEVFALLLQQYNSDYFSGLGKLRDMVSRMLWYELCMCTAGSPTTFVEPTLPTNTPEPVLPPAPANAYCDSYVYSLGTIAAGQTFNASGIGNFRIKGVTAIKVDMHTHPVTAPGPTVRFDLISEQTYPSFQVLRTDSYLLASTANSSVTLPVFPGADDMSIHVVGVTGSGTTSPSFEMYVYCGVPPTGTQSPCCPPDQSTQAYLDQILSMVTLIQRQSVPFSYVYGANHTALTGHGSIAVSGLIGCSVDVTTLPASYGREDGSPEHLFDVGFISLGTADGYQHSQRIESDGTLFLPSQAGAFTAIGYTLGPGVEVSIRELVREP
jgi:hypothetical protein